MLDRLSFATDIANATYLFADPKAYDEKSVQKRWKTNSSQLLISYANDIEALSDWATDPLESRLKELVERENIGIGEIMFPVRLALTGLPSGPDLYQMMILLGKESVLRRLQTASHAVG